MKLISAPNIARLHELAIEYVLRHGSIIRTEDGEITIEAGALTLECKTPRESPRISSRAPYGEQFYRAYADELLNGTPARFDYDYYTRLNKYAASDESRAVNQIDYIARKLKAHPESRRAVAVTWIPAQDELAQNCPCLQLVQCTARAGKLNMHVVFRSNDMLLAAGANMYALTALQSEIARAIDLDVGTYTHIALVPHIYFKRDASSLAAFCGHGMSYTPRAGVCDACKGCRAHSDVDDKSAPHVESAIKEYTFGESAGRK